MKKVIASAILASIFSVSAMAATQGGFVVGDKTIQSTGTVDVTLSIKNYVQINRLNDIALGDYASGDGDKVGNESFCVRTNADTFSLNISSSAASGFELQDDFATYPNIPYTLEYAKVDSSGVVGTYAPVTSGTDITGINELRKTPDCIIGGSPKDNIALKLTVAEAGLLATASPSDYSDVITLIASPE